jgi:hypothetical protein
VDLQPGLTSAPGHGHSHLRQARTGPARGGSSETQIGILQFRALDTLRNREDDRLRRLDPALG